MKKQIFGPPVVALSVRSSNSLLAAAVLGWVVVVLFAITSQQAPAATFDLGSANGFGILELGSASQGYNVSLAQGGQAGKINGNVGIGPKGSISDNAGLPPTSEPINGSVYLYNNASQSGLVAGGNVSGTINQGLATDAYLNAAIASALGVASSAQSGAIYHTDITAGGTISTPGDYSLSQINLGNHAVLTLQGSASDYYIFNISDKLVLNSASIVLSGGIGASHVLFNLTGTGGFSASGGIANGLNPPGDESVLYGVVLAPDSQISLTPGAVVGELIGGMNINIASGASIEVSSVPDGGSSLVLMGMGLGLLGLVKAKLIS
ncbi:MAG TPA: hypothetical protein VG146_03320 [Verrucomicrobiae bacterium]|nr:hypothetical protein [Verrucomicrobiae bacterium]